MDYNQENNITVQDDFQAHEEVEKMNKSKQAYKDTITLIKLKMSKADTLIRQYNDKMKECDLLNEELAVVMNDKEDTLKKYNQTMEKLTRIELLNSNYKESLETLKNLSENQKIKLDENEKHINQLLFKIKEIEQQLATLQEHNKALELDIKSAKASAKIATKKSVPLKHQASQTLILKTQETSVNTDSTVNLIPKKLKMKDKSIITDDISYGKKEPFPIFCSKCDILIEPAPVDQILKIMSFNPPLLSECLSPPNSPNLNASSEQVFEPIETTSFGVNKNYENNLEPIIFGKKKFKSSVNVTKEIEHSSFMEMDSLHRKISKLENLIKKVKITRKRKKNDCCSQTCCSSKKNIKFIVQLPSQEEIFDYHKRKKRKQQKLKYSKRRLNILKRNSTSYNKWIIENCFELKKKQKLSSLHLQGEKRLKKKKKILNQEQNILFQGQKDLFSDDETAENYNCLVKSLPPSHLLETHPDSLPFNERMESYSVPTEKLIQDVNINQLNTKPKIVNNILGSSQVSVCNTSSLNHLENENSNLPGTNSAINKISEKNEIFYSACKLDIRIENKETNGDLVIVNDRENLEMSSTSQLPNKISNGTNSKFVEHNKARPNCFTQPKCMENQSRLSTNSSLFTNVTQIAEQEDKSLLSTKFVNNKFTCSLNVNESQKFNTDITNENILFTELPCELDIENVEQVCKKSENRNVNAVENSNSQLLCDDSIELKMTSPLITKPSINLPIAEPKPKQKVNICPDTSMQNNLFCMSADKDSITNDFLLGSQTENVEQNILSNEIEYSNDNATVSEESSEEYAQQPASISSCRILNRTAKRSSKLTGKRKLLSIIRNIKKSRECPISANKTRHASLESSDNLSSAVQSSKEQTSITENIPVSLSTKKQRIAHTPKSFTFAENELKINNINEISESKVEIITKEITSVNLEQQVKKNDKISSLLESYDKTCKERIEIAKNFKTLEPPTMDFSLFSNANKFITKEDTNRHSNDYNLRDLSQDLKNSDSQESFISDKNYDDNTVEISFIGKGNALEDKEMTGMNNEVKNPTRELRSRQVIVKKDSSRPKAKKFIKFQPYPKVINEENSCLNNSIIVSTLNDFIANFNNSNIDKWKRVDMKKNKNNEKFIEKQLELLMQAEWTMNTNSKIIENLLVSLDLKTLAFFLIEFASEKFDENEEFDKSHTPPAPMMTRSEQKLVALILSINKMHSNFADIVIEGIRFKLFRLGKPQMEQVVERLFRILVVLNKIKKDREKVRIFLCDALYCLNIRAINMIYVALTCWAEVLPKHSANNDILVKTIVHIVMTLEANKPYSKLSSLRKLLSTYYEYPNSGYKTTILKDELLNKLQENAVGVNTAVLLLCKKMGPAWSMENIIKGGLKHMIVEQIHPSLYEALNLLGNILRSFPKTDSSNNIGEIIDQLCDVLAINAGSDELQEGVLSCLLSISKYRYEQIARAVIKWQSNKKDLQVATKKKLNSFLKSKDAKWWWAFVSANFPSSKREKT